MLRNDAIYNLLFRFRDVDLNNINDINLAINIVVIATTLLEIFIIITLIFKLVIIIVFNVDIVIVIVIVIIFLFEGSIFKLIAFNFNIKDCFIMGALLDKS